MDLSAAADHFRSNFQVTQITCLNDLCSSWVLVTLSAVWRKVTGVRRRSCHLRSFPTNGEKARHDRSYVIIGATFSIESRGPRLSAGKAAEGLNAPETYYVEWDADVGAICTS